METQTYTLESCKDWFRRKDKLEPRIFFLLTYPRTAEVASRIIWKEYAEKTKRAGKDDFRTTVSRQFPEKFKKFKKIKTKENFNQKIYSYLKKLAEQGFITKINGKYQSDLKALVELYFNFEHKYDAKKFLSFGRKILNLLGKGKIIDAESLIEPEGMVLESKITHQEREKREKELDKSEALKLAKIDAVNNYFKKNVLPDLKSTLNKNQLKNIEKKVNKIVGLKRNEIKESIERKRLILKPEEIERNKNELIGFLEKRRDLFEKIPQCPPDAFHYLSAIIFWATCLKKLNKRQLLTVNQSCFPELQIATYLNMASKRFRLLISGYLEYCTKPNNLEEATKRVEECLVKIRIMEVLKII